MDGKEQYAAWGQGRMYSHIHYGWVNTSKWRKTDYKKIMSIWNVLLLPTSLPDQLLSCAVCCFLCALSKNTHTKVHGEDKLADTLNYKAKCWNHFLGRKTTNQQLIVDLRVWGGPDCLSSKDVNILQTHALDTHNNSWQHLAGVLAKPLTDNL